ncbi:hypothetical protein vseg_005804 [Gypsophila vaccaria]
MVKSKPLGPHSTVISLLRELNLSGVRPDLHSDCILTNCYCHLGRADFGFSIFGKSLKLGNPVGSNIVVLNTLLKGLVDNDQFPQAVQLLDKVVAKLGTQPSLATYGTLIKSLCSLENNAAAFCLLRHMDSRPSRCQPDILITPNVATYSMLVAVLCKMGLMSKAMELLSLMEQNGCSPDSVVSPIIQSSKDASSMMTFPMHYAIEI